MTEWNSDMDSAPKDGTHVLIVDSGVVSEAYWAYEGGGWWLANTYPTDYTDGQIYAPTHWQPLPPPPETTS